MKKFKYEEFIYIRIIGVLCAFAINIIAAWLYDFNQWQYYALLIALGAIDVAFVDFLSYQNIFVKTGNYYVDGMSLYINKSKSETEIPMDMVDSITVTRTGTVVRGYEINIKLGRKEIKLSSERVSRHNDFWDTELSCLVREILDNNSYLTNRSGECKDNSYLWQCR